MKRIVRVGDREPLLEIVSYGRGAPKPRKGSHIEQTQGKGGGAPEVMIKVSGGARTLNGVRKSLNYFGRGGKLGMENDTGELLLGREFHHLLVGDWNLELETHARQEFRATRVGKKPPRLVHNLIFSMPPGTPPEKVLKAVKRFAVKEFGDVHRHAMVLHTDEPHPHVHMVVKATSERGDRLYIKKATLRAWRQKFAFELRELGVPAKATERAGRGMRRNRVNDFLYRVSRTRDAANSNKPLYSDRGLDDSESRHDRRAEQQLTRAEHPEAHDSPPRSI